MELWWFGGSDDAAFGKVKSHVEQTFAGMVAIWAATRAASMICMGLRMLATRTWVSHR